DAVGSSIVNITRKLEAEARKIITRRFFLRDCGIGVGSLALASLLKAGDVFGNPKPGAPNPFAPRAPHFTPKAKRFIYLFQAGAPSQLDLFDYKPALAKYDGKTVPAEVTKGQEYAFIKADAALFASKFKFKQHGQAGAWISEVFPALAEIVD